MGQWQQGRRDGLGIFCFGKNRPYVPPPKSFEIMQLDDDEDEEMACSVPTSRQNDILDNNFATLDGEDHEFAPARASLSNNEKKRKRIANIEITDNRVIDLEKKEITHLDYQIRFQEISLRVMKSQDNIKKLTEKKLSIQQEMKTSPSDMLILQNSASEMLSEDNESNDEPVELQQYKKSTDTLDVIKTTKKIDKELQFEKIRLQSYQHDLEILQLGWKLYKLRTQIFQKNRLTQNEQTRQLETTYARLSHSMETIISRKNAIDQFIALHCEKTPSESSLNSVESLNEIFLEKERYEGEFKNDFRHGLGAYYFQNGEIYCGNWHKNRRQGKGIYYFASGKVYDGSWVNSKRHGYGEMYYLKDSVNFPNDKIVLYKGNWSNDKKEGYGTVLDGDDYITANFANGKIETIFTIKLFPTKEKLKQILFGANSNSSASSTDTKKNFFADVKIFCSS